MSSLSIAPDGRTRLVRLAVLAAPSLLLLERAWDRRWMTDDGFINLRVVKMIEAGHGPVFNAGERVEATTSTLWLWMLTAADIVVPLRLEWVAVLLGLACSVAGLACATAGAVRLQHRLGATGPLVPLGAAVIAVVAVVWDFSTSGLEGGLVFGWLGLCGYVLGRWADTAVPVDAADPEGADAGTAPGLGIAGAAVLGLGPLVRPDLLPVSLVLLGGVLLAEWRTGSIGQRLRFLAAAGALPVVYEIWRMGYYAALVPNTALAKSGSRSRWEVGYAYLRDFVGPYRLWLPLLVLLAVALVPALVRARAAGQQRVIVALTALPLAGLLYGIYVVRVGGDYMHGRLLLPAFFALLVPVAAVPLPQLRRPGAGSRRELAVAGGLAVTAVWALVCGIWLRPPLLPTVSPIFSSDARHGMAETFGEHAVTVSDVRLDPTWAKERLAGAPVTIEWQPVVVDPPGDLDTPVFAGWGIGSVGYALGPDVDIVDLLGLSDPVTARFELPVPGFTGHEKPVPPPWLAAQISTVPVAADVLPIPAFGAPLYTSPPGDLDADADAARRALRCGDLERLLTATRAELTPGRFLSNLVAAPRNTLLTVPPDPDDAVDRFC